MNQLEKLLDDRDGTTSIEYALISAIVGAALVSGLPILTDAMNELFREAAANINLITDQIRRAHRL